MHNNAVILTNNPIDVKKNSQKTYKANEKK